MKCEKCGKEFEEKFCPECGTPAVQKVENVQSSEANNIQEKENQLTQSLTNNKKKPIYKNWWFWVIIVVAVIIIGIIGNASKNSNSKTSNTSTSVTEQANNDLENETIKETTEQATTEEPTTEKPTTEEPTKDPKVIEEDFKNSCVTIDFETLSRNPDKYKGNNYKLEGEVIQVQESSWSDTVELRINITKETFEYIDDVLWTDTIYATVKIPDGSDRILEDDVITFWGTCDGMYTYESVLGSSISLPKIDIKYYELNN